MYVSILVLLLIPIVYLFWKHVTRPKLPVGVIADVKPIDQDFDWKKTEPLKLRPFYNKKDFRPNMGIKNLSKVPEEWLLIENTYLEVTSKKYAITCENTEKTIQIDESPRSVLAAREYYDAVTNFLVKRYPQYFIRKEDKIYNKIRDELIPGTLKNQDPIELYKILSGTMEEDVVVFLKDDPTNEEQEYTLRSGITGFPSGFDPSLNQNKVISQIHDVVPQYHERLKLSMGRFFNRLQPSDLWVRFNWTIQTHDQHYNINLNHGHPDEEMEEIKFEDIDFEKKCFLRCERQVLTRLPKLKANIMTVRTYLYPMSQIKEEGLAEELSRAIDALPEDLALYKRRPAWGKAVKQYLLI